MAGCMDFALIKNLVSSFNEKLGFKYGFTT